MKKISSVLFFSFFVMAAQSQTNASTTTSLPDSTKKIQVVEASCGMCQFGVKTKECSLAIRIDGKVYLVDGTTIDEHGDAHAKDGFCEAIRKAEVQGEIVNNRFKATYFKLVNPVKKAM